MITACTIQKARRIISPLRRGGVKIGFVPTMGALHEGHLSLIRAARRQTEFLAVSIFVNPIQFGPREDFRTYPRRLQEDKKLLERERVDLLFLPSASQMYGDNFSTYVEEKALSSVLCGASRPGHFRGVATVVTKLFHIIEPHISYFGRKDYQQAQIIKKMAADLNFDIKIKVMPIVRDRDGLALSSRNAYLDSRARRQAVCLYQSLRLAKDMILQGRRRAAVIKSRLRRFISGFSLAKIDYLEIVDARSLKPCAYLEGEVLVALAVFIKNTRLIDNMLVQVEKRKFSL